MNLTRDDARAICKAYSILNLRVKAYEMRRETILNRYGSSVATVPGKRTRPSGDPTAGKVQALEKLEQNYLQALTVTWAIDEAVAALGKEASKIFNLYFVKGLTVREVAQKMKLTKSSIHRRIAKILDTVAYWLAREEEIQEAALNLLKTL